MARRAVGEGLLDVPDIGALHRLADAGAGRAAELLHERATALGRAAAFVRDMLDCDRVVLVGQGFTEHLSSRTGAVEAFEQSTTLSPTSVGIGLHGPNLQAVGACTVALVRVREDPLGLVAAAHART